MRRLFVLAFLRVFKIWDAPALGILLFRSATRSIYTHCGSRIYSQATTNQLPVWKLLSAVFGYGSPTTELSFGVAATSTSVLARHRCRRVIRLWSAQAKNFRSTHRRADAAPGSRFPAESMWQWCAVVDPGI